MWVYHFLEINFRFQSKVCIGCHDMTQKYINFNDAMVVTVGRNDHMIDFWGMNRMKNAVLSNKCRQLYRWKNVY